MGTHRLGRLTWRGGRFAGAIGLAAAALAIVAGCGGAAPPPEAAPPKAKRLSQFPTPDELAQISQTKLPERLFEDAAEGAAVFTLKGPLPDAPNAPRAPVSKWEGLLAGVAAENPESLVMTEAMGCVAREVAWFYIEKGAMPEDSIKQFITARCGAPESSLKKSIIEGNVKEGQAEEAIFTEQSDAAKEMIQKHVKKGKRSAGIAFARKQSRIVVMLVSQQREVNVDAAQLIPDKSRKVFFKGQLLKKAASVQALINRGRFGVADCVLDDNTKLPAFAFSCETAPDDPSAWIEMAIFPPDRVLGEVVLSSLVFPAGKPENKLARRDVTPPITKEPSPADVAQALNALRKEAGLSPVELDAEQSKSAARLAPYYFAAVYGRIDRSVADQVALGLRAGWSVGGMVRQGALTSSVVAGVVSTDRLLDRALATPFGRSVLLAPDARRVAVGPVLEASSKRLGALFITYSLVEDETQEKSVATVLARLSALRAERKLSEPVLLSELGEVAARVSESVRSGKQTPREGMKEMIQQGKTALRRGVRAWMMESNSLETLPFEEELLRRPELRVSLAVAYYKRNGEPWARIAVIALVESDEGQGAPR